MEFERQNVMLHVKYKFLNQISSSVYKVRFNLLDSNAVVVVALEVNLLTIQLLNHIECYKVIGSKESLC